MLAALKNVRESKCRSIAHTFHTTYYTMSIVIALFLLLSFSIFAPLLTTLLTNSTTHITNAIYTLLPTSAMSTDLTHIHAKHSQCILLGNILVPVLFHFIFRLGGCHASGKSFGQAAVGEQRSAQIYPPPPFSIPLHLFAPNQQFFAWRLFHDFISINSPYSISHSLCNFSVYFSFLPSVFVALIAFFSVANIS